MNNFLKHVGYYWVHELKTATTIPYATSKSQANFLELESQSIKGQLSFYIFKGQKKKE